VLEEMRHVYMALPAVALAGTPMACGNYANVQCESDPNCNLTTGGICAPASTGNRWCAYPDPNCPGGFRYSDLDVGDGLSGVCVAQADAGVPPDGSQVAGDQLADLVIGQPGFEAKNPIVYQTSDKSLSYPTGLAVANSSLWVLDSGGGRALRWNPIPQISYASAVQIVGRSSYTDASPFPGANASNLYSTCCYTDLAIGENRLVIADIGSNRVLVWNPLPASNGADASFVLGQVSPACCSLPEPGTAANRLSAPSGVWTDGVRLAVADAGNNRVLIWTTFPTTNGEAADIVLGQAGFDQNVVPAVPTASSMRFPRDAYFDGTRFYVSDSRNNRVLVWSSFPTMNGQAADYVIGQPNFSASGFGASDRELAEPIGIDVMGTALFIADNTNSRILIFDPIPTESGTSAKRVLGQPDFTSKAQPTNPSAGNLFWPSRLAVDGKSLYITDSYQHRVLRFDL
jgi:sugar lactone lactonase YvrE